MSRLFYKIYLKHFCPDVLWYSTDQTKPNTKHAKADTPKADSGSLCVSSGPAIADPEQIQKADQEFGWGLLH